MKKKKYKIPEELVMLNLEAHIYDGLCDKYVNKRCGGWKKAVKAKTMSKKKAEEFWYKTRKLYPELKDKQLEYFPYEKIVRIIDKKEE